LDLIEWMREYNRSLSPEQFKTKSLYFIGMERDQTHIPGDLVLKFMERTANPALPQMRTMAKIVSDFVKNWEKETDQDLVSTHEFVFEATASIRRAIRDHRSSLASRKEKTEALRQLELFRDAALEQTGGADGSNIRDNNMAKTIFAMPKVCGPHIKTMLWAHNGHISKETYPDSSWIQVGVIISRKEGHRYYALGQCFLKGSFAAVDGDDKNAKDGRDTTAWKRFTVDAPTFPTIAGMFARIGDGNYIVDFDHGLNDTVLRRWLDRRQDVRECATWFADSWKKEWDDGVNASIAYDGMTFINTTTAETSIPCSDKGSN
jgi:erythromycin esterase